MNEDQRLKKIITNANRAYYSLSTISTQSRKNKNLKHFNKTSDNMQQIFGRCIKILLNGWLGGRGGGIKVHEN
jgi:hypothetical protein